MLIAPEHRKILCHLIHTRVPITPTADNLRFFEELFSAGYLEYAYNAHSSGYVIGRRGIDEVTVHRQRNML
jgi:hypothetical protein